MKTARQNFADHVTDKLTVARRQNEQVYHDTVPPVESLELTSGQNLLVETGFYVAFALLGGGRGKEPPQEYGSL